MGSKRNIVKVGAVEVIMRVTRSRLRARGEIKFVAPASHAEYAGQFTHVALPLDASLYDDEAVKAAVKATIAFWDDHPEARRKQREWESFYVSEQSDGMDEMRAAIAAYANHVAGGGA